MQETWTPTVAPSLFAKVLIPDENVIPKWEQPDSTNPYMTEDKVRMMTHIRDAISEDRKTILNLAKR